MSTIDLIAEARKHYLASPQSRLDWVRYLGTVTSLQRQRAGQP